MILGTSKTLRVHINDILQLEDWLTQIHLSPAIAGGALSQKALRKLADIRQQNGVDPFYGKVEPIVGDE